MTGWRVESVLFEHSHISSQESLRLWVSFRSHDRVCKRYEKLRCGRLLVLAGIGRLWSCWVLDGVRVTAPMSFLWLWPRQVIRVVGVTLDRLGGRCRESGCRGGLPKSRTFSVEIWSGVTARRTLLGLHSTERVVKQEIKYDYVTFELLFLNVGTILQ